MALVLSRNAAYNIAVAAALYHQGLRTRRPGIGLPHRRTFATGRTVRRGARSGTVHRLRTMPSRFRRRRRRPVFRRRRPFGRSKRRRRGSKKSLSSRQLVRSSGKLWNTLQAGAYGGAKRFCLSYISAAKPTLVVHGSSTNLWRGYTLSANDPGDVFVDGANETPRDWDIIQAAYKNCVVVKATIEVEWIIFTSNTLDTMFLSSIDSVDAVSRPQSTLSPEEAIYNGRYRVFTVKSPETLVPDKHVKQKRVVFPNKVNHERLFNKEQVVVNATVGPTSTVDAVSVYFSHLDPVTPATSLAHQGRVTILYYVLAFNPINKQ